MKHKFLISKTILGFLATFCLVGAVHADGISAGLSAVRAPVSANDAGTIGGVASGWRAHVSYKFNTYFGIEGGFSKFGSPNDSSIPSNMHVETEAYDVYAVAYYPLGNDGAIVAKAGWVAWDTESEINDTNEMHQRSDNLGLSLGGQYFITDRFGLRAELEWFDSAISNELKYSLGGIVRF